MLAGELAAGQPPGRVLATAATVCPALAGAVAAHRLGGSVPDVAPLRGRASPVPATCAWSRPPGRSRTAPGPAWPRRSTGVAVALRERQPPRRLVGSELASARATARLMAALPVLTLLMGSGIGGDPSGFLLGSPGGWACLAGGLAFGLAGLWWIEAIAGAVEERAA